MDKRFVSFSERCFDDNIVYKLDREDLNRIKETKWNYFKWKNLTLMKDPMSLTIYLQLLQDIKPKTILEFGTFHGGSALWMRDVMQSLKLECTIHTFDIVKERVELPSVKEIVFHHLDVYEIQNYVDKNVDLFHTLPHPILMIEDCHVNVLEVLNTMHTFLNPGDYMVVEDTISKKKYDMLGDFMNSFDQIKFLVDSHYCDFWGANNSWNFSSILKKV